MNALARHDPGGKVRCALPVGLRGDARISDCGRYRLWLKRWIGESFPNRWPLFIGMNPSTADAAIDDRTMIREWCFAADWGYQGLVKVNVSAWRATDKRDIPTGHADHPENLATILAFAADADRIILCHGCLPRALLPLAAELRDALKPFRLFAFGLNADGSAKHPLYLPSETPLREIEDYRNGD